MEPSAKKMRTENNSPERGHYSREHNQIETEINCCGEPDEDLIVRITELYLTDHKNR